MMYPPFDEEPDTDWISWWRGFITGAAVMLAAIVLAFVVLGATKAEAYDKSICGVEPARFERMWADEAGEHIVFGYVDRIGGPGAEGETVVIKYMFVNPDTKTWTLVFQTNGGICTMRNGDDYAEFEGPVFNR